MTGEFPVQRTSNAKNVSIGLREIMNYSNSLLARETCEKTFLNKWSALCLVMTSVSAMITKFPETEMLKRQLPLQPKMWGMTGGRGLGVRGSGVRGILTKNGRGRGSDGRGRWQKFGILDGGTPKKGKKGAGVERKNLGRGRGVEPRG